MTKWYTDNVGFWDGTATDWGTAVGTVGLALITTVAVIREGLERKALKMERDAARKRTAELERENTERGKRETDESAGRERRLQAEAVSCYIDTVAYEPNTVMIPNGDGQVPIAGASMECAIIRNLSTAPIRHVEVYWQNAQSGSPVDDVPIVPANTLHIVPPSGLRAIRRPTAIDGSWTRPMLALLIKFDDAKGVRWARRDDGRLYSITDNGALGPQEP